MQIVKPKNNNIDQAEEDLDIEELHNLEHEIETKFKVYPYRYVVIITYILAMFQIGLMQNSFAPQAYELQIVYDKSAFTYNLTSLVHMFVHIPVSFPANYIVEKYGTKVGNTIACIFTLIGSWLRLLVGIDFNYAILGQTFVGIANPFIANISNNWFYPIQRPTVTAILSFSSIIVSVIGIMIPGLYFQNYKAKNDKNNYETGKYLTFKMLFIQALMVTFIVIVNFLFFIDKPETPPSYCAAKERESFEKSLKILIRKKTYILICISFSFVYGTFIVLSVILDQILAPFGFLSSHTSYIGTIFVFSGILGTIQFLNELKEESRYTYLLKKLTIGGIISLIAFQGVLYTQTFWLVCIPTLTLGFFVIPLIPIILELANEVCYPIGEAVITGFIYSFSHGLGFLLGVMFSFVISLYEKQRIGCVICTSGFVGLFICAFCCVFCMKVQLKRTQAEKQAFLEEKASQASGSFFISQNF